MLVSKEESVLSMLTQEACCGLYLVAHKNALLSGKSLAVGANKTALVSFLVAEWSTKVNIYAPRLHNHYLIVTCKEACTMLFSPNGTFIKQVNMPELCSSHKEVDTRLLLHAAHASHAGFNTVVIRSPGTDVAILALFFFLR